jgi:hypothetical protein
MKVTRRLEFLGSKYVRTPRATEYHRTGRIVVTWQEFQLIDKVKKKLPQLNDEGAEALTHAYYLVTGRRLSRTS